MIIKMASNFDREVAVLKGSLAGQAPGGNVEIERYMRINKTEKKKAFFPVAAEGPHFFNISCLFAFLLFITFGKP